MHPFWPDLYAGRAVWATRAYKGFVEDMDPSLQPQFARGDDVSIVVYGPTQVGKTTLILNILGLRTDSLHTVAHVLRGGSKEGASATAAPTRYRFSVDDQWRIGDATSGPLGDLEASEKLAELRRRLVSAGEGSLEPLEIFIPAKHRDETQLDAFARRILDLPGINAESGLERHFVERLASRYVTTADLVVLATRADLLGTLHPDVLQLDALRHWQRMPDRFRVVLTHTFSLQSIQDSFRGNLTVDAIREALAEQTATHDGLAGTLHSILYPVEFGDSWDRLALGDPGFHAQAKPVVDALLSELRDSLKQADNPYGRLKVAMEANRIVHDAAMDAGRELLERLAAIDENLRALKHDAQTLDNALQAEISRASDRTARMESLEDATIDDGTAELLSAFDYVDVEVHADADADQLAALAECRRSHLETEWRALPGNADKRAYPAVVYVKSLGPPPAQTAPFRAFSKKMGDYSVKSYLKSYWGALAPISSFDDDVTALRTATRAESQSFCDHARAKLAEQKKVFLEAEREAARVSASAIARHAIHHGSLKAKISASEEARLLETGKHHEYVQRLDQSDTVIRTLSDRLVQSHEAELASLERQVMAESDPARLFFRLAARQLHVEARFHIEGM